jgi:hypothetical protein
MDTEKLIEGLAQGLEPVRLLPRPWRRTAAWLLLAVPYVALVVFVSAPHGDPAFKGSDWRFVVEQLAALATAMTAAMAAFATTIPGYNRKFLLPPVVPLAFWLGSLGQGCVQDWIQFGRDGVMPQPDWSCFPVIVLVGAIPALTMAVMLRRGAPLTPHATVALGGLAAAGLGNFGLRFFHPQDASLMLLVWQLGSVFVLSVLAAWAGRYLLNWRSVTGTARRKMAIG